MPKLDDGMRFVYHYHESRLVERLHGGDSAFLPDLDVISDPGRLSKLKEKLSKLQQKLPANFEESDDFKVGSGRCHCRRRCCRRRR